MSKGGRREGAGRRKGSQNKATAEVKALAQEYTVEALERLVALMRSSQNETVQLGAIKEILDRGHGKSPQAVTVDPGNEAVEMMKELLALADGQTRGLPQHQPTANAKTH